MLGITKKFIVSYDCVQKIDLYVNKHFNYAE